MAKGRYIEHARQARRFTEFVYAPFPDGISQTPIHKLGMRAMAEAAGMRTSHLYATFASPAEVALGDLPERFVLKTDALTSRQGVFPLTRQEDGSYHDSFRPRVPVTEPEIVARIVGAIERRRGDPRQVPVLAEEWIAGENGADKIPFDYKFYTFDGVPRLVVQIDRNLRTVSFFDEAFEPLEEHCIAFRSRQARPGSHLRPTNWRQMLEAAGELCRNIGVPFMSVDTYTTGTEVIVGELTQRPGGSYYSMWRFSDEFDAELGTYYRLAYASRNLAIPIVQGLPPVLRRHKQELEKEMGVKPSLRQLVAAVRRRVTQPRRRP